MNDISFGKNTIKFIKDSMYKKEDAENMMEVGQRNN